MTAVFIGIGSNAADAPAQIAKALTQMQAKFELQHAQAWRSPAAGFDGAAFVNLVVQTETNLALAQLVGWLKQTEITLGKDLTQPRLADKVIDLDLLFYGDTIISNDRFVVPARDALAPYYLAGLNELAPAWRDPESGHSMAQLWAQVDQQLEPCPLPAATGSAGGHQAMVQLDDLQIALHLGVTESERARAQTVSFNLRFEFSALPPAALDDDVVGTMNYSTVARALTAAFSNAEFKTIEHLVEQACIEIRPLISLPGRLILGVRKFPTTPGLVGGAYYQVVQDLL